MNIVGILVILLALACIGAMFLFVFAKKGYRLPAGIFFGALYLGFLATLLHWCGLIYAGGNLMLARATFAVGGLVFGTILLGPTLRKNKVATWIDMSLFLLLAVAFVILAVLLSKTVIQPNAPLV